MLQRNLARTESNEYDWSKLDDTVASVAKTVHYSQSMYGAFDTQNDNDTPAEMTQRQRQHRPKATPVAETHPVHMSQAAKTDKAPSSKLTTIVETITKVSIVQNRYRT